MVALVHVGERARLDDQRGGHSVLDLLDVGRAPGLVAVGVQSKVLCCRCRNLRAELNPGKKLMQIRDGRTSARTVPTDMSVGSCHNFCAGGF